MGITYHRNLEQGSDEWLAARCGLLTASEMKLIITPTLKTANNEKERSHLYELLAQRITGHVEPRYISDDMLRGMEDELEARALYGKHYGRVEEVGFITNDRWGFTIGYSPDALVDEAGLLECKSRRQKFQIETIVENMGLDGEETIPSDYMLQCQTGLLVSERKWLDFVSYSGGLHMVTIRVYPIQKVQDAILAAASDFEERMAGKRAIYEQTVKSKTRRLIPTQRRIIQDMHL